MGQLHAAYRTFLKVINLEDILLKSAELGVLGVIVLIMLTKGLSVLTALTLAIDKLADKINLQDGEFKSRLKNIAKKIPPIFGGAFFIFIQTNYSSEKHQTPC